MRLIVRREGLSSTETPAANRFDHRLAMTELRRTVLEASSGAGARNRSVEWLQRVQGKRRDVVMSHADSRRELAGHAAGWLGTRSTKHDAPEWIDPQPIGSYRMRYAVPEREVEDEGAPRGGKGSISAEQQKDSSLPGRCIAMHLIRKRSKPRLPILSARSSSVTTRRSNSNVDSRHVQRCCPTTDSTSTRHGVLNRAGRRVKVANPVQPTSTTPS